MVDKESLMNEMVTLYFLCVHVSTPVCKEWLLAPTEVMCLLTGTSLSVIVNIPLSIAIVSSSAATIFYTMFGQMISVAYTDIVQLIFIIFGLVCINMDNFIPVYIL